MLIHQKQIIYIQINVPISSKVEESALNKKKAARQRIQMFHLNQV